jgi:vomeronasal 2 receptor
MLSDHDKFTSLYQMAAKDTSLILGMVSLMLHFKWTWLGMLIAEDHKGFQILSDMREEMEKHRICVAFVEVIPITLMSHLSNAWSNRHQIIKS